MPVTPRLRGHGSVSNDGVTTFRSMADWPRTLWSITLWPQTHLVKSRCTENHLFGNTAVRDSLSQDGPANGDLPEATG